MIKRIGDKPTITNIRYEIISERVYGQPKLSKPTELKGIKHLFSIPYLKTTNQVFIKDDIVYIKLRDHFSPSVNLGQGLPLLAKMKLMDIPTTRKEKFIYADSWGDVVLRSEAWISIQGLISQFKRGVFTLDILYTLIDCVEIYYGFERFSLYTGETYRMYESLCFKLREVLNES